MADYSGAYEGDGVKTPSYSYNQTLYMPVTYADVQRAVKEAVDALNLKEDTADLDDEASQSDEKSQDTRNDYSRGFDAGWDEGYEAARHEAVVAVVKAIVNL